MQQFLSQPVGLYIIPLHFPIGIVLRLMVEVTGAGFFGVWLTEWFYSYVSLSIS
jgi:hypothetical protein